MDVEKIIKDIEKSGINDIKIPDIVQIYAAKLYHNGYTDGYQQAMTEIKMYMQAMNKARKGC